MIYKSLVLSNSGAVGVNQSQLTLVPAVLLSISGYCFAPGIRVFMLFNNPIAPILGDIPDYAFIMNLGENFSLNPYIDEINSGFNTTYWIGSSAGGPTYIPSGTVDMYWSALYGVL
jgi:hypothetical protein